MTTYNIYQRETLDQQPVQVATGLTSKEYSIPGLTKGKYYYLSVGAEKNGLEKISTEQVFLAGIPWTPENLISQYKLMLDYSTIVLSGSNVATWNNKNPSIPMPFSQSSSSKRPTRVIGGLNGYNTVRFDGSDDILTVSNTAAGNMFRNAPSAWSFIVFKKNSNPNGINFLFSAPISTNHGVRFSNRVDIGGNTSFAARRLDSDVGNIISVAMGSGFDFLLTIADYQNNIQSIAIDGTPEVTSSISSSGGMSANTAGFNNILSVGGRSNDTSFAAVEIACLIVGSGEKPSLSEFRKLEGWAAHKYGLTSRLPDDHPYKTLVPTL